MRKTEKYCDITGRKGAITLRLFVGKDSEGVDGFEELDIHPSELQRRLNNFCNRGSEPPCPGKMLWKYLCANRKTQATDVEDDR